MHPDKMQDKAKESGFFNLNSDSSAFTSRTKDVFASLGDLEARHAAYENARKSSSDPELDSVLKDDPTDEEEQSDMNDRNRGRSSQVSRSRSSDRSRSGWGETRGSDFEVRCQSRSMDRNQRHRGRHDDRGNRGGRGGNFRAPNRPAPRPSRPSATPDYKKHPERWTCYSLDDVPEQDMSDRSNQRAALVFLEERKRAREKEERRLAGLPEEEPKFDIGHGACSRGAITFSRPKNTKTSRNTSSGPKAGLSTSPSSIPESCDGGGSVDVVIEEVDSKAAVVRSSEDAAESESDAGRFYDDCESKTERKETEPISNSFKSRKNVKRHIRKKENDDSD